MTDHCKKRMYGGSFTGRPCGNRPVDGYDGYCAIHFPPNVAARKLAKNKQWDEEFKRRESLRKLHDAERDERDRKLAAFPGLLAALKDRMDLWNSSDSTSTSKKGELYT